MTNSALLRFPLIDALRGIAALLVLIYHVIEIGGCQSFPGSGMAFLFRIGWIGVDLFFVISGFVIGRAAIAGMLSQPLAWKKLFLKGVCIEFYHFIFFREWFLLLVDPSPLLSGWGTAMVHILSHLFFCTQSASSNPWFYRWPKLVCRFGNEILFGHPVFWKLDRADSRLEDFNDLVRDRSALAFRRSYIFPRERCTRNSCGHKSITRRA